MTGDAAPGWVDGQLAQALGRIETLARDVARLQATLGSREQEVSELRQALDTLDGRTRRHEVTQEAIPELRSALVRLDERLTAESALRRDQFAAAGRGQGHEHDVASLLERDVIALDRRVAAIELALRAAGDRDAHVEHDLNEAARAQQQAEERLAALQAHVDSVTAAARGDIADVAALREGLGAAVQHIGAVEARTDVMLREIQRLTDEMLVIRRTLDRETALVDLVEQLRVLRLRVEEGLAALAQRVDSQALAGHAEAEGQSLVRRQLHALDETVTTLTARVEAQRQVLLDHFRRVTDSAEDAGRRQTDEIDRQVRAARELLVRLAESADDATREPPL